MTKKKSQFAAISQTVSQGDDVAKKIAAFTQGGRADRAVSTPAAAVIEPSTPSRGRGRPALTEETRRTILALRKEDVHQLEELALRWKRESDGLVSIKTTMVMRSLLAAALPLLTQLEGIEDEAHLRDQLHELLATNKS